MNEKMTLLRLEKETADIINNPIENAWVTRVGKLNFHFCLHDLQQPYSGGFYHGLLELHQNYPLSAPKLYFYTPTGRFQINTPICTSFTNFHQETWTPSWRIRTLIVAIVSFMYSEEPSYGCRKDPDIKRKYYADNSLEFNMKNIEFVKHFGYKVEELNKKKKQIEMKAVTQIQNISNYDSKNQINQELLMQIEQQHHQLQNEQSIPYENPNIRKNPNDTRDNLNNMMENLNNKSKRKKLIVMAIFLIILILFLYCS